MFGKTREEAQAVSQNWQIKKSKIRSKAGDLVANNSIEGCPNRKLDK